MLTYLAVCGLITFLFVSGILPKVSRGPATENYALSVKMNTHEPSYATSSYRSTYAQEVGESFLGWVFGFIACIPVGFVLSISGLPFFAIGALSALSTWLIAGTYRRIEALWQISEYVGHTMEILDYSKQSELRYSELLLLEAPRTKKGYPIFKDYTNDQVHAGMKRWEWLAKLLSLLLFFNIKINGRR